VFVITAMTIVVVIVVAFNDLVDDTSPINQAIKQAINQSINIYKKNKIIIRMLSEEKYMCMPHC
jgi:hypothetical protein